jgi:hypothetical protein
VILLDVVLGYGSHPDPGLDDGARDRSGAQTRRQAHARVRRLGLRHRRDPQNRARQEAALRAAGVMLAPSNAAAVRLALRSSAGRQRMSALFDRELRVVNIGISSFADAIRQTGGQRHQLDGRRPRRATERPAPRSPRCAAIRKSRRRTQRLSPPTAPRCRCSRESASRARPFRDARAMLLHCRPADRVAAHVRADAGRDRRRDPA